jgi:Cu/Ag efflux pump CusA
LTLVSAAAVEGIAGMLTMAARLGEGGGQSAPLGRPVIGGLLGATFATLIVLPAIFAMVQHKQTRASGSLHPEDSERALFPHKHHSRESPR